MEFFVYENYATFDKLRKLKWNNNAIIMALRYYHTVLKKKITYDDLMEELKDGKASGVLSMLYGAVCAADSSITLPVFNDIYKAEHLKEYITAVYEGIKEYLPEPEIKDTGEDLDPSWPDTQSQVKKSQTEKTDWGYWIWIAKSKLGMTMEEIKETSLRAIIELYWQHLGERGVKRYDGED